MPTKEEFLHKIETGLAARKRERSENCEQELDQEERERIISEYIRGKIGSRGKYLSNKPFYQC